MYTLLLTVPVVCALFAHSLQAQQRPEFSGEWVRADSTPARSVAAVGDAAFRRGDMGSGWGNTVSIAQRPDSIIVAYDFFSTYDGQPRIRLAYATNGAESRNAVTVGHAETMSRAKLIWQGATLVITTQFQAPKGATAGGVVEMRQALTLDSTGALNVETTRGDNTVRSTYRRK
jgi:hypothetical protein